MPPLYYSKYVVYGIMDQDATHGNSGVRCGSDGFVGFSNAVAVKSKNYSETDRKLNFG